MTVSRIPQKKETPSVAQTAAQKILERDLKRYIALCPFDECEFNKRKPPELHLTDNGAEVEGAKHLREKHADSIVKEVKVKRKQRVVDEDLEIVE